MAANLSLGEADPMLRRDAIRSTIAHLLLAVIILWLAAASALFPWQDIDDNISWAQARRMLRRPISVQQQAPLWAELDVAVGRTIRERQEYTVVLFVSSCEDCNRSRILSWAAIGSDTKSPFSLLVVPRNTSGIRDNTITAMSNVTIYHSNLAELWRQYQVDFTPRVYLIDSDGMLRYIQPPSETSFDAVESVKGMISHR